ncbi:MAG: serine hydrolase domain-containing protein [Candidatus Thiodiazotropha sp.]
MALLLLRTIDLKKPMGTNLKYILLFLLILFSGCGRDGPLLTDMPVETISAVLDKEIPDLMQKRHIEGLSLVIIRKGKSSISKSFGYADVKSNRQVDEQTVFRAASLGKPVFAYILVSLARQGIIDLDTPLYEYSAKEVVKDDTRSKAITARMVLKHTSGLPNLGGKNKEIEFLFDPDTGFEYSGYAYLYLQEVIETVTGRNLNKLASELVFRPLRMTESGYVWQEKYRGRMANSYGASGEVFPSREEPVIGHSAWSLFTTIADYARFVLHMIETSNTQHSIASVMLSPQVDVADGVRWGLGWGLQETTPNYSFWHWGSMAGFRHYVVGYPKEKTAVIVFTNNSRAFKMVDEVMAMAIGGGYPSYEWF